MELRSTLVAAWFGEGNRALRDARPVVEIASMLPLILATGQTSLMDALGRWWHGSCLHSKICFSKSCCPYIEAFDQEWAVQP